MKRHWVLLRIVTLSTIALLWAFGCGKGKKGGTTVSKAPKSSGGSSVSYDYEEYAPLPRMLKEVTLPMLVDDSGVVEKTCFKLKEKMNTASASMDVKAAMGKHPEYLKKLIANWLMEDVGLYGITENDVMGWDIEVPYPVALEMDPTTLRFEENEECIGEGGWLDDGVRVATTLIGARSFNFVSDKRLSVEVQDNMKQALEERGFTVDAPGLELYKPILDDDGAQKYNDKEEALYTGPGGINITEKDLPPEAERGIKEWVVKVEEPVYFAFQQLPDDAWQKESKKKACNVFLVWGDVTPRSPECPEFTGATFVVERKGDNAVKVEVTVDSDTKALEMEFEQTQRIMMADRAILWLNAKKEEEGVTIRLNSLVIGEIFPNKK